MNWDRTCYFIHDWVFLVCFHLSTRELIKTIALNCLIGTPSDVLPQNLKCEYEKGSEAEILRMLTSDKVITYEVVEHSSVISLLQRVAQSKFNALIDSGNYSIVCLKKKAGIFLRSRLLTL